MNQKKYKKPLYKHPLFLIILSVVLVIVIGAWTYSRRPQPSVSEANPESITQLDSNTGTNSSEKNPNSSTSTNQGTATDNNGASSDNNNPATWTVSESRVITVKEPSQGETIQNGAILAGIASVSQVQYTLIDDDRGVISQGTVSVVNGNFSANLGFKAYAKTGRLDVYSSDANGKEVNLVQIPVKF